MTFSNQDGRDEDSYAQMFTVVFTVILLSVILVSDVAPLQSSVSKQNKIVSVH
jgi:hypothetical protein